MATTHSTAALPENSPLRSSTAVLGIVIRTAICGRTGRALTHCTNSMVRSATSIAVQRRAASRRTHPVCIGAGCLRTRRAQPQHAATDCTPSWGTAASDSAPEMLLTLLYLPRGAGDTGGSEEIDGNEVRSIARCSADGAAIEQPAVAECGPGAGRFRSCLVCGCDLQLHDVSYFAD